MLLQASSRRRTGRAAFRPRFDAPYPPPSSAEHEQDQPGWGRSSNVALNHMYVPLAVGLATLAKGAAGCDSEPDMHRDQVTPAQCAVTHLARHGVGSPSPCSWPAHHQGGGQRRRLPQHPSRAAGPTSSGPRPAAQHSRNNPHRLPGDLHGDARDWPSLRARFSVGGRRPALLLLLLP